MSIYPTLAPQSKGNFRHIPSPNAVDALWLYDGQTAAGILIERDRLFYVFNTDGQLVGEYRHSTGSDARHPYQSIMKTRERN